MNKIFTAGLAALMVASMAACSSTGDNESSKDAANGKPLQGYDTSHLKEVPEIAKLVPEKVKDDGVLMDGVNIYYAPAEFYAADGVTPLGYDIDMTRALAAVMGLKPEYAQAEFASIIPSIGSKYEVGIANFSINAKRLKQVNMIQYFEAGSAWSTRKGNPKKFDPTSPCGFTVGVQTGTIQDEAISDWQKKCPADKQISIQRFASQGHVTTALVGGKLDAMYTDSTVADYAALQTNGATERVGEVTDVAPVGIVIAKEDAELTKAVQAALQYLIDKGELKKIFAAWGIKDGVSTQAVVNPEVK